MLWVGGVLARVCAQRRVAEAFEWCSLGRSERSVSMCRWYPLGGSDDDRDRLIIRGDVVCVRAQALARERGALGLRQGRFARLERWGLRAIAGTSERDTVCSLGPCVAWAVSGRQASTQGERGERREPWRPSADKYTAHSEWRSAPSPEFGGAPLTLQPGR